VLVTGASGLIGSHLLGVLDREVDVVALSRHARADEEGVRWLACDLTRPGAVADAMDEVRPQIVIHLAGAVRGDRTLEAVGPTLQTNLVATVELLQAAIHVGSERVVLSGSLLEEPEGGAPHAVPPSPYGASRWAASAYGRMFHALFDTPVVNLRLNYTYGPGQEPTKLIPYVTTALLRGESPQLSTGERPIEWIYAEDVARAYLAAATRPGIEGRTIDIGSGELATVNEIVAAIVREVGPSAGRPVFGKVPVRPLEQHIVADVEATAAVLGWRATTRLEDGLRRTVEWFRDRHASP
jgi:nucleoside-diphosphate-sugar epimerase